MITVTIEGLDALRNDWRAASAELEVDLRGASLEAAAAGVAEAQDHHPYVDHTPDGLTGSSHAEQGENEAEMEWPVEYASFVDKGTSRMSAYPFTPQAEERAESELQRAAEASVNRFAERLSR